MKNRFNFRGVKILVLVVLMLILSSSFLLSQINSWALGNRRNYIKKIGLSIVKDSTVSKETNTNVVDSNIVSAPVSAKSALERALSYLNNNLKFPSNPHKRSAGSSLELLLSRNSSVFNDEENAMIDNEFKELLIRFTNINSGSVCVTTLYNVPKEGRIDLSEISNCLEGSIELQSIYNVSIYYKNILAKTFTVLIL